MFVRWSNHSEDKFAERAAMLGINYGDIDFEIKKQEFKIWLGGRKYKTVFQVGAVFITAIKLDDLKYIHIITLWESNRKEVLMWKNR